jgi:muramoyltetrapeptide carboxypeptidase LdcA involved in peptidoglycan recycling
MMIPRKLKAGDNVRIIAPSCTLPSMPWMDGKPLADAKQWFTDRGMTVSDGKYIREINEFGSTSIAHRLKDLHDAFRDPTVHAMITVRGGWNVNQLLPHIDYGLIKKNPKILCGFSDITALSNAIFAKTGLVTYSGPNFSQFCYGDKLHYTHDYFEAALLRKEPIDLKPSPAWTDTYFTAGKPWPFEKNPGWRVLRKGKAEGTCIGGNLCTLSLLQGTEYMPTAKNVILLVEDDHETHPRTFDRDLTSLTQQPWFESVRGVLFGRFQRSAVNTDFGPVTPAMLDAIVANNARLKKLPIIADVDFGHTYPSATLPIGGTVAMDATKRTIVIKTH